MTIMTAPIQQVASLYRDSQTLGGDGPGQVAHVGRPQTRSFGQFVQEAGDTVRTTFRTAEATAAAGIRGRASIQEVVFAVQSAKMTMDAVVSVRNRMVEAYQDIMRMPV